MREWIGAGVSEKIAIRKTMGISTMQMSSAELKAEARRLHGKLHKLGWEMQDCELIAPTTLEINRLKKEHEAIILAHPYQTPDIMYGVGDYIGDSYGLSRMATEHPAAMTS